MLKGLPVESKSDKHSKSATILYKLFGQKDFNFSYEKERNNLKKSNSKENINSYENALARVEVKVVSDIT